MAQGEAASVLVRAYQLTNDMRFLEKARLALEPFLRSISLGGVQSQIDGEWLFLEEYPTLNPEHVLNGFLYALIGLIEYCEQVPSDEELIALRDLLAQSLVQNIDKWGAKNWSYYQIPADKKCINSCTPKYHNIQISQLTYVVSKLKLEGLTCVIERWSLGAESLSTRLYALFCKVEFRLKNRAQR